MTRPTCELCGEPMPPSEEMFKFHGYSGPCPKPPKPPEPSDAERLLLRRANIAAAQCADYVRGQQTRPMVVAFEAIIAEQMRALTGGSR